MGLYVMNVIKKTNKKAKKTKNKKTIKLLANVKS